MANLLNPWPVPVPSDDSVVRRYLRDLDQPATYFGEGPGDRRERLAKLLINLPAEQRTELQAKNDIRAINGRIKKSEVTYSEGSEELKRARLQIAEYSIQQSNYRLDMARIKQLEPLSTRVIPQQDLVEKIRQIDNPETYLDDETASTELKTLTSCSFSPDATLVCTSCRSGRCKVWSMPNMETHTTLRGHQQSANHIQFSPKSGAETGQLAPSAANLASCAMDGSVILWNLIDGTPLCHLSQPHSGKRITRIRYHPTGLFLAACCSDNAWRLWDLQSETELLVQVGHADAVFDLAYHPDGSLAGSASLDSFARIWDLRTGKSIHLFEGHSKGIRTIDFSPNGYHIATGGLDNTVKVWNLRQRRLEYTIPAHLSAVSSVVFEKEHGFCLATASFDKTVKFWSSQTWAPLKTLGDNEEKVSYMDLTTGSDQVISCYGKYLKLWTSDVSL